MGLVLGGLLDAYLVVNGLNLAVDEGQGMSMSSVQFDPILRARVTVDGVVQPLIAVFTMSVVASLWPAIRVARLRPVAAIRQE